MCLFVLCVLCLSVLVNCLLNGFDIYVGKVIVFSLKVIVLFLDCVFLLANICIVFQSVCVVFVIPYVRFVCVCVCMRDVISEFHPEIKGSHAFCVCGVYFAFWDVVFVCMKNYVSEVGVCSVFVLEGQ